MDAIKIYEYALQREREGRDFFRNNAWERQHEELFKTMHDRAFEEYAAMPWGG